METKSHLQALSLWQLETLCRDAGCQQEQLEMRKGFFSRATVQPCYMLKQLVPSIQPSLEQVGLSRPTAPSLTWPPSRSPQQLERNPCQDQITHKAQNKMG
ncbi:hypothetical protein SRHO_G00111150 [Serrasalmus rhombeus]